MVIDTPGLREIQVWGDEKGIDNVFSDIQDLADNCRF
jgi:ribosome biogenesis GTPase